MIIIIVIVVIIIIIIIIITARALYCGKEKTFSERGSQQNGKINKFYATLFDFII